MSPPRGPERLERGPHPPHHPEQVDLHQAAYLVLRHLGEPPVVADAGVVEPGRERGVVERRLGRGAVVGGIADVVGQPLLRPDLGGGVGGGRAVDVGEDDGVAAGDQQLGDGAADAAGSAGDDGTGTGRGGHARESTTTRPFEQVFDLGVVEVAR